MNTYDIIFIGGGPAGYEGAIHAAKKGLKTVVVEKEEVGGTCLQWGCIPTKHLLHLAGTLRSIEGTGKEGIRVEKVSPDLKKIEKKKRGVVKKLTRGIHFLFQKYGVERITGTGKIEAPGRVSIDGKDELAGRNLVLATGTAPADLPFLSFDNDMVWDSRDALTIDEIPDHLLVVGAGAIGLEMATLYRYLGSRVTVVEMMNQILPGTDAELAHQLQGALSRQKIRVITDTSITDPRSSPEGGGISVEMNTREGDKKRESFSRILLAVGRVPVTRNLWSTHLSLVTTNGGYIKTDPNLCTSVPGIFACGDIIGPPLLAHKASHEAIRIVNQIAGEPVSPDPPPIPAVVFTFPELATVGLSESEAKKTGIPIVCGRFPYAAGSRSNAMNAKTGLVKVIAHQEDHRLLGGHILGETAGELIQTLNLAISRKLKAEDFAALITAHPTLSENVTEAVGEIGGFSIHI